MSNWGLDSAADIIKLGLSVAALAGFLVFAVFLANWLIHKKRRDEEVLEHLIQIQQRIEMIRDRLKTGSPQPMEERMARPKIKVPRGP